MTVGQTGEQTSSDSLALQDRRRSHTEAGPLTPSELELVTRSRLGPEQVCWGQGWGRVWVCVGMQVCACACACMRGCCWPPHTFGARASGVAEPRIS